MFTLKNLCVSVENKPILNGVSLSIKEGEIHVLMGSNGSGKSTLANAIMGHPLVRVTSGDILIKGKSLLKLNTEKRAKAGIFLSFQQPREIPGVTVSSFLGTALKKNPLEVREILREKLEEFEMDFGFSRRHLNEGFSGGEKKKMELVQMAILEPKVAVLDEPDSGLDVDALKIVAKAIRKIAESGSSVLLITHYQRILKYLKPDFIHILARGKIVASGGQNLARELERKGYAKF